MRKTPLKPRKPIWAYCADKRAREGTAGQQKPRSGLKRVSSARVLAQKVYGDKRRIFMAEHPQCQAGLKGCTQQATECHHAHGRTGKNYLDASTFRALCAPCHRFVHAHPNQARTLGLLK